MRHPGGRTLLDAVSGVESLGGAAPAGFSRCDSSVERHQPPWTKKRLAVQWRCMMAVELKTVLVQDEFWSSAPKGMLSPPFSVPINLKP